MRVGCDLSKIIIPTVSFRRGLTVAEHEPGQGEGQGLQLPSRSQSIW
jgi:hypothetical protein